MFFYCRKFLTLWPHYLDCREMVFCRLRFLSVAVTFIVPLSLVLRTTKTALPLNSFIVGSRIDCSEVASPLQAASNIPAPSTDRIMSSSRVGQNVPALSVRLTVM